MITTEQLAKKWNVTPQMIRYLIGGGRIAGVIRNGRGYLIPSDVKPPRHRKPGPKNDSLLNIPTTRVERRGGYREGAGRPVSTVVVTNVGSGRRCPKHGIFVRKNNHGCRKCREEVMPTVQAAQAE